MLTKYKIFETKFYLPIFISIVMFLVLFFSSIGDVPTADEPAHIASGYAALRYGDYRLNTEHPPIIKVLASSLTVFMDGEFFFPYERVEGTEANFWSLQWQRGIDYLYFSGNDPQRVLLFSRLPMFFLAIILANLIYFWALSLYGKESALLAICLFGFSPTILGHSKLVTTDLGAALGVALVLFFYVKLIEVKKCLWIILSSIALAFAILSKFSTLILFPVIFLLIIIASLDFPAKQRNRIAFDLQNFVKDMLNFSIVASIALIMSYIVYYLVSRNTSVAIYDSLIFETIDSEGFRNLLFRLRSSWLMPIGYYFIGLYYALRHSAGGHLSFLLGNFSYTGWWYYFPVIFFLKTQIVFWVFVILALINQKRRKKKLAEIAMILFIAVYLLITLNSSINIGIRHLIPIMPFVFILSSSSYLVDFKFKKITFIFLMLLYIFPIWRDFPNYISYSNQLVSKDKKHNFFIDSNLDWGQDLLRLGEYVNKNKIDSIYVDYFGGGAPVNYYIPNARLWNYEKGTPDKGFFAISATALQFSKMQDGGLEYGNYFSELTPVHYVGGGSILVYLID